MPSSAGSAELVFAWKAAAFPVPAEGHVWDRLVPLPPFPEELKACSDIGKNPYLAVTYCSNRFKPLSLQTSHEPAHGVSAGTRQTGHAKAALISLKYCVLSTLCFLHSKALNPQAPPPTTAQKLVENRSATLRTAESPNPTNEFPHSAAVPDLQGRG